MVYWPLVVAQSTKYLIFAIFQKMVAWTVELLYEVVLPLENNLAWCKICADTSPLDYGVHTRCSEGSRRERKLMQRHILREHEKSQSSPPMPLSSKSCWPTTIEWCRRVSEVDRSPGQRKCAESGRTASGFGAA